MRILLPIAMACLLAGSAQAQRGAGHVGGVGGGMRGPAGIRSGGLGGLHGGSNGFRGFSGFRGITGFRTAGYVGGYSYWPMYSGFGYGGFVGPYYDSPYDYGYAGYAQPNVTVVYPAAPVAPAPTSIYVEQAHPVTREYDRFGQEVKPAEGGAGSPIYLLAFKDQVIRAAVSYSVSGSTLRYVTMQHEEKQASLDTIDRELTLQLNRERHVPFQLP